MSRRAWIAGLIVAVVLAPAITRAQAPDPDPIAEVLDRIEQAVATGDRASFMALAANDAPAEDLTSFAGRWIRAATTSVTLRERERRVLDTGGRSVLVDALVEAGSAGRVATWQFTFDPDDAGWRLREAASLGAVDGLHRLALEPTEQWQARDLVIRAEDLEIRLPEGNVFVARAAGGITAAVLLGRGEMVFSPAPEAERRQVAIFAGTEELRTEFDAAFLRFHPDRAGDHLPPEALSTVPVDLRQLARARAVFEAESIHSYHIDVSHLSAERWSLLPPGSDLVADVRTRRFNTLTYVRSGAYAEDISLFDRARQKIVAIYSSREHLAARGRSWSDTERVDYDVLDYGVDVQFDPARSWFSGSSRLVLRVRQRSTGTVNLRLARTLTVTAVVSDQHGRLLALRVPDRDRLLVTVPEPLAAGDELALTVSYAGRLESRGIGEEQPGAFVHQDPSPSAPSYLSPLPMGVEPTWLYSSESAWYAQGLVLDHGTATIRLTLPLAYGAACSGAPVQGSPVTVEATDNAPARRIFLFSAREPIPYLACAVSRFRSGDETVLSLTETDTDGPTVEPPGSIRLVTSSRDRSRARDALGQVAAVTRFYASLIGEIPYRDVTLAAVEGLAPGGHSPAHLVVLRQPMPESPLFWGNDPVIFARLDDFYLAHEVAHQWWGQAVGWKNYHEQWLSEGLAQYFAALYVKDRRGPDVFRDVLSELVRWTRSESDQGPVSLGYRVGHIQADARAFRAVIYNKGAIVLHMLRLLLGDDAFFDGLRRYYREHRFSRAGTDDLRAAMEQASGRPLHAFFEHWIYGRALPAVQGRWSVDAGTLRLSLLQQGGPFTYPLPVTIVLADGRREQHVVGVDDPVTEVSLPLSGPVRAVLLNDGETVPVDVHN